VAARDVDVQVVDAEVHADTYPSVDLGAGKRGKSKSRRPNPKTWQKKKKKKPSKF
jgi:hypothetical protein